MTEAHFQRVRTLFEAAAEFDSAQRATFLDSACADDPGLRAEVESLLRADHQASAFLATPLLDRSASPEPTGGAVIESPSPGTAEHSARATNFSVGEVVAGRYRIDRFLARGGMGEVYQAVDLELGGQLAIKTVRALDAAGPQSLGRLKREISLSRRVTHPNVCRVFDLFQHRASANGDSVWFFTMELLEGETLAQRLARVGPMTTTTALPILEQVVAALAAAHRAGVIHRDLKASNVQLTTLAAGGDPPRTVVTDFGLARSELAERDVDRSLTASYMLVGTPSYMAPEQVRGEPATAASDLYALGVLAYEMVTGQLPFRGDSQMDVAVKRLVTLPTPPGMYMPGLDPDWEAAILRCLEREPRDRFASVTDFLVALRSGGTVGKAAGPGRYRVLERHAVAGLGEALLADDTKRNRRVALKELPSDFPHRQVLEGRAVALAQVRHPGIAGFALDDLGGAPALVVEIPSGRPLAAEPGGGRIDLDRLLPLAIELCRAVGAAHEQGLVHGRLTRDQILVDERGAVHVTGFGLAGLFAAAAAGDPPDRRSDLHAIGRLLDDLAPSGAGRPARLSRLIDWCLQAEPSARPQSAFDLAHQLAEVTTDLRAEALATARSRRRRRWITAAAMVVTATAAAVAWVLGSGRTRPLPQFQRLTYQRGEVELARFGPDGQTVFYSARWNGAPSEVFTIRPGVPEPLALGIRDATLLAVGETELQLLLHPRHTRDGFLHYGTLARAAITGGTVRPMREGVVRADYVGQVEAWTDLDRLEFPTGSAAGAGAGHMAMRISPDGKRIALLWEERLTVAEAGSDQRMLLVDRLFHGTGVAWGPDGREVWLSRLDKGQGTTIVAYDLAGNEREVYRAPGRLALLDVGPDGRALVAMFTLRREVSGGHRGQPPERDLTWLGDSCPIDLSADGTTVLLADNSTGMMFGVRGLDGSAPIRLGGQHPSGFSADGERVLVEDVKFPTRLIEVAIGAGEERTIEIPGLERQWDEHAPGGYVIQARRPGADARTTRLWRVAADGSQATPITPEGWEVPTQRNVSPDGRWVLARAIGHEPPRIAMFDVVSGASRVVDGLPPGTTPQGWSSDGGAVFSLDRDGLPARVLRTDIATGASETWLALQPSDPAGVEAIQEVVLTPDGETHAYSYFRTLSELYLVSGLR